MNAQINEGNEVRVEGRKEAGRGRKGGRKREEGRRQEEGRRKGRGREGGRKGIDRKRLRKNG